MAETPSIPLPLLLVVTGRPGAGKTSLAHALSRAVRCPAICRDEMKEGFVNTAGEAPAAGDAIGRQVYEAFFETMTLLLRHRITLVAEAAFQHKLWSPKLEPLRSIARLRIVVCTIDPRLARSRHIAAGWPIRSVSGFMMTWPCARRERGGSCRLKIMIRLGWTCRF